MRFDFPAGLYSDVRTENVFETKLQATLGEWEENRERSYEAAFVRVFDGTRWYYTSTTDTRSIQREIEKLASLATKNRSIEAHPIVDFFETNVGEHLQYSGTNSVKNISVTEKAGLLAHYFALLEGKQWIDVWRADYLDQRVQKSFQSSKGADVSFDYQRCGIRLALQLSNRTARLEEQFDHASNHFEDMNGLEDAVLGRYDDFVRFLRDAQSVDPGDYQVVLSPRAAGVFAHESFGHRSEADFMLGDDNLTQEWQLGRVVGSPTLSIIDDGSLPGLGQVLFDDEGTRSRRTFLVENGALAGRLHSATTAVAMGEQLTGNARARSFEFEPIVRMTTTFIEDGDQSFESLVAGVDEGVLVETVKHGSGMSTFTLAPGLAYRIRSGKIAEPLRASVISGSVFEALAQIDGVSDSTDLHSYAVSGCGKMEQTSLPVGFGGPWVRVRSLKVR